MTRRLHIRAAGMVTPVGLDAASSCAAMRARLDGFCETRFIGPGGEWLIGAPVPLPRNWIGPARMARLLTGAIVEIFRKVPEVEGNTAYILCLAEEARPGRPIQDATALIATVIDLIGLAPDTRMQVVAHGRPSGFVALARARQLMAEGATNVIIAGVDSYLTTISVAHYLSESRLLTPDNANGFIPGEAAAAILCTAGQGPLALTGLGLARETAFIYNGQGEEPGEHQPLRGDGMTTAYRLALDEANCDMEAICYRVSDVSGESYFFRQTALASLRTEAGHREYRDLWTPAESIGNVGAAALPLMLGLALTATEKGYSAGTPLLVEGASDDGACGAAVVHRVVQQTTQRAL